MAREKFHTLTEQMFYILLCLTKEQCGTDLMSAVSALTGGRVIVGPGMIEETKVEGRRRSYRITAAGRQALAEEYRRLITLAEDYRRVMPEEGAQT